MKQYIDKSALIAEIENLEKILKNACKPDPFGNIEECMTDAELQALDVVKETINTIEVKELDLDNEYTEEIYSHLDDIKDTADRMTSGNFMHNRAAIKFSANTIAKVLELMGLKAQEGEYRV